MLGEQGLKRRAQQQEQRRDRISRAVYAHQERYCNDQEQMSEQQQQQQQSPLYHGPQDGSEIMQRHRFPRAIQLLEKDLQAPTNFYEYVTKDVRAQQQHQQQQQPLKMTSTAQHSDAVHSPATTTMTLTSTSSSPRRYAHNTSWGHDTFHAAGFNHDTVGPMMSVAKMPFEDDIHQTQRFRNYYHLQHLAAEQESVFHLDKDREQ